MELFVVYFFFLLEPYSKGVMLQYKQTPFPLDSPVKAPNIIVFNKKIVLVF